MANVDYYFGVITYPDSKHSIEGSVAFLSENQIPFNVFDANLSSPAEVSLITCLKYQLSLVLIQLGYARHLEKRLGFVPKMLTLVQNLLLTLLYPSFRNELRRKISRNRNISENHFKAWSAASNLNCQYIIVLEDDAHVSDFLSTWLAIQRIVEVLTFDEGFEGAFILDLSRSFSLAELGLTDLVSKTFFEESSGNYVHTLLKPATNTLCAVLFNSLSIKNLITFMENRGIELIHLGVPIDWIVNDWLILEAKNLSKVRFVHIKPGLFLQKSLHSLQ